MSISGINTQLLAVESNILGVQRALTRPKIAPEDPDLPCIVNDYNPDDFLSFFDVSFGSIGYEWKFTIKFLISPTGLGTLEEWDSEVAPYFARFVEAMFSHLTMNDSCDNIDFLGATKLGMNVQYLDKVYFGFESTWVFRERLTPTIEIAP